MLLNVYFNGHRLNDYCVVRNVYPIVPENGKNIEVEVDITIKDDIHYNLDMLNRLLYTRDTKELIVSDLPDRYIMAKLKGPIKLSSRFFGANTTLKFIADSKYWKSSKEPIVFDSKGKQEFVVTNNGTAPTSPLIQVDFPTDNGYLAIVSPNGFLQLGDSTQQDTETKPKSERVLSDTFDTATGWTKITSNSHANGLWIPDYSKLNIGSGTPTISNGAFRLSKSTTPKSGYYWNSWGYYKNFVSKELSSAVFNNWRLNSKLRLIDKSGTYKNTGMFLIVVMDNQNRPIITTSLYNEQSGSNDAYYSVKVNDFSGGNNLKSKIIHSGKFQGGFTGNITMKKEGDEFYWELKNDLELTKAVSSESKENFKVGDTVYIKNTATYYYHTNYTRYAIKSFTRGRANKITGKRTYKGKTQFEISYGGVRIAWLFEEDLTSNKSGVSNSRIYAVSLGKETKNHTFRSSQLSKLVASKVVVIGGTWDVNGAMSDSGIYDITVDKINTGATFYDVDNTFNQGDRLIIDNATGEILLNGGTYQGPFDYNSRFFDVDYGDTELTILKSDWATLPNVLIKLEERYR